MYVVNRKIKLFLLLGCTGVIQIIRTEHPDEHQVWAGRWKPEILFTSPMHGGIIGIWEK